ncbi:hypothetical protein WA556_005165, partial [Blastocystis sp. ATCC 50177/Nand II]
MSRFPGKTNSCIKDTTCPLCSGEMTRQEGESRLCSCGFHICHWCLEKVIHESNSCPRCGKPYSSHVLHLLDAASDTRWDDNTSSSSAEQERRRNNRLAKQQTSEYGDLHYLQSVRIIQRCLVYIIGLAPSLANEATLRSSTMFGQYGKIKKIILNSSAQLVEKLHSCCAYITFSSEQEALSCIMACDGCVMRGSQIRASFGTTKYCNFFLRGIRCTNTDCMYLHAMAAAEDCFTKREMQTRQAEFHARTHPCHAEAASTPAGEEVACLPPPRARTRSISDTSSVSLHSV